MNESATLSSALDETMCCPTCNAEQIWSDVCRRCRCDTSLLHQAWQRHQFARLACLNALRTGRFTEACRCAQQQHEIAASSQSARMLAVCHLLAGNWQRAFQGALGVLDPGDLP
jgi:hypothetical protein